MVYIPLCAAEVRVNDVIYTVTLLMISVHFNPTYLSLVLNLKQYVNCAVRENNRF